MYLRRSLIFALSTVTLLAAGCSDGDPDTNADSGSQDVLSDTSDDTIEDTTADTDSDTDTSEDTRSDVPTQNIDLQIVQNPRNALSFYVSWDTPGPTFGLLTVDCGDNWTKTYETQTQTTEHEVFVMGLWDGATCEFTAESVAPGATPYVGTETLDVGPVPDFLPDLAVTTHEAGEVAPGWTLFNLTNDIDDVPLIIAIADPEGRYRWYHQRATSSPGGDTDARIVEEGILVGGIRRGAGPVILDWEGRAIWEPEFEMHHHLMPYGDHRYLYLAISADCPMVATANTIRVWDREQGELAEEYPFCRWFVPDEYTPDWDHLNSAEVVPGENALLTSSRNQNSLIKIDLDAETAVWQMGPGGDFDMAEEDLFWQQHSPEFQENGQILLFDNGLRGTREYSRAIEIAYDTDTMNAEVVWEYAPEPKIFTPIWGDSDRLSNGNTLSTFGHRQADKRSHLHEVDAQGNLVWALETPNAWGWYRSERIDVPEPGFFLE